MNEFEKKYYESSTFWENEMLQDENNMERFRATASYIKDDVKTILDAGCGNGVFLNYLNKEKPQLVLEGVDRSLKALEYVKVKKKVGDISSLPYTDNSFDCISCLEVLEHLPIQAYEQALDELVRVSKKYLILSVPYNERLEDSYTKCPSCKSIFNFELHLRRFTEHEFSDMLNTRGFKNVAVAKLNTSFVFKYHSKYRRIFYPEQFLKWNSPVCPLCGYEESVDKAKVKDQHPEKHISSMKEKPKRKFISYFSVIPKMLWPKEKKYYWNIGLFQREEAL
jgi:SAM-dependent methyltransferase